MIELPRFQILKAPEKEKPEFLVISATDWNPGVIPIFSVQKQNRTELRWRPPSGQENGSDPLFFAWAEIDDASAVLSGFWKCEAIRGDGSQTMPDFEITIRNGQIAGRFNHYTENKYASLTGGSITNDEVRIEVSYIQDHYRLTGKIAGGFMEGAWVHLNGEEKGTWRAWREHEAITPGNPLKLVNLYEWTHKSDLQKVYLPENEKPPGDDWIKAPVPLCRVAVPEAQP
ncbi:MAG: hypothetical protein ACO1QB_05095 [Verrucomicrobiales bacterium]